MTLRLVRALALLLWVTIAGLAALSGAARAAEAIEVQSARLEPSPELCCAAYEG